MIKKLVNQDLFDDPEKYIPKGGYCYDEKSTCPFWDIDPSKPQQENGYCHYLKESDWLMGGLLWDQCKECNINDDEFPQEY